MRTLKFLKINLVILAAFLSCLQGISQNPNLDYTYGIRVYNTTSRVVPVADQHIIGTDTFYFHTKQLRLLDPAIGLQRKGKKDNFHEIQLAGIRYEVNTDDSIRYGGNAVHTMGDRNQRFTFGIRYEYDLLLLKRKNKRILPTLGFYGTAMFDFYHNNPGVPYSFESTFLNYHLRTGVVPGVMLFAGKRLFFSAQFPLTLYDIFYARNRLKNPALTTAQQSTSTYGLNSPLVTDWAIRLGLGLKL